jgi:alpha-L-fucosidase
LERLLGLGRWLDTNGEAIFDTRPWQAAESRTLDGIDVRFTQKAETLYATLLAAPQESRVVVSGLIGAPDIAVRLLGGDAPLAWEQTEQGLAVQLPPALPPAPAHSLAITPQPAWTAA